MALRALHQGNIDIGVLQELKLTQGIHTWNGSGYDVWATEAEIHHRGGIAVAWRAKAGWQVEGFANYGPNMVSVWVTMGQQRWYVVGAYVNTKYDPTVAQVEQALWKAAKGTEVILLGDLNVRLQEPHEAQEEELAMVVAACGLKDMTSHFIPRRRYR